MNEEKLSPGLSLDNLPTLSQASNLLLHFLTEDRTTNKEFQSDKSIPESFEQHATFSVPDAAAEIYNDKNSFLYQLFYQQVLKNPNNTALFFKNNKFTYGEVNSCVLNLAKSLKAHSGEVVGLYFSQHKDIIISILALWSLGCTYLPLDTKSSSRYIENICLENCVNLILTNKKTCLKNSIPKNIISVIKVEEFLNKKHRQEPLPPLVDKKDHAAYIMYTSGSTGKPKGVCISQSSVINLLLGLNRQINFQPGDCFISATTYTFDISIVEWLLPLITGGTAVLLNIEQLMNNQLLNKIGNGYKHMFIQTTPSVWHNILRKPDWKVNCPLVLLTGGETLDGELAMKLLQKSPNVWNCYGPTETTIWSTIYKVEARGLSNQTNQIPIGKPLLNTTAYVLDERLNSMPVGFPGELYLGGTGLMQNYIGANSDTSNHKKLIPNPFKRNELIYKTGDKVCWLPDGNLQYFGRFDDQVKIRGFRIDLNQVASVLEMNGFVKKAIVLKQDTQKNRGSASLTAYLILDEENFLSRHKEIIPTHCDQWEKIYDNLYQQSSENTTFNTTGWISSYTGEQLSKVDMQEWTQLTVEKIISLSPQRVLEVGCGMGLLLFPIAPQCQSYHGTDISSTALAYISAQLEDKPYKNKVSLSRTCTNSLNISKDMLYDTIIINSVIQYFPHIYFLIDVLDRCINAIQNDGKIFVGDVRSLRHLKLLHASSTLHRSSSSENLKAVKHHCFKFFQQEKELAIDPSFFLDYAQLHTRVSHVNIELKPGFCKNEMNDYRYDVVIHIEKSVTKTAQLIPLDWQEEQLTLTALTRHLKQQQSIFCLSNIPNPPWLQAKKLLQYFNEDTKEITIAECPEIFATDKYAVSPCELKKIGLSLNYEVFCIFPTNGKIDCFDAHLYPKSSASSYLGQAINHKNISPINWQNYANKPWYVSCHKIIQEALHQYLLAKLPHYMIPTSFIILDEIPTVANGKLDKEALVDYQSTITAKYQAANNAMEQEVADIWKDALGMQEIGVNDNFFQLGGHSLNALRIIQAIEERWDITFDITNLFALPTIFELTKEIEKLSKLNAKKILSSTVKTRNKTIDVSFSIDFNSKKQLTKITPTSGQKRLWFLNQYEDNKSNYNIARAFILCGRLDIKSLRKSFKILIERHEALRSCFRNSDTGPVTHIKKSLPFQISIEQVYKNNLSAALTKAVNKKFDLTTPPLISARLLNLSENENVLIITMHHIISDGRSLEIIAQELSECYTAFVNQKIPELPDLKVQYLDFINWLQEQNHKEQLSSQLNYWKKQLHNFIYLNMPTDFLRPVKQSYTGDFYRFVFDKDLTDKIRTFSIKKKVTFFMTTLAAFNILLSRYSHQEDIVIGSPIDNRKLPESQEILGFFNNTVALRNQLIPEISFEVFLQQVKQNCLETYTNQFVPFELLVDELKIERKLSCHPIFQIMFVWSSHFSETKLCLPGIKSKEIMVNSHTSKFDLTFEFAHGNLNNFECRVEYNTDLYKKTTVQRMTAHLQQLFREIVDNPGKAIKDFQLLTTYELKQICHDWNSPVKLIATPKRIHDLFLAQANKTPERTALVFKNQKITYAELDGKSAHLANLIQEKYISICGPHTDKPVLIGICVERSLDMVVGILAILKSGAAYVPLDPNFPKHRLKFIIEDTNCQLILTHSKLPNHILKKMDNLKTNPSLIYLDIEQKSTLSSIELQPLNPPSDLMYVIYTSGTTGNPKGITQTHQNVHRLFAATDKKFKFNEHDVWVLFHSYTFDFSIWEIWGSLLYGGCLVIPTHEQTRDPALFHNLVSDYKVTVLNQTPSAFQCFSHEELNSTRQLPMLRYIIFGGERLTIENLSPWWDKYGDEHPLLINMYGITETTIHTTYKILKKSDLKQKASNIGKPLEDVTVYIVDNYLNLLPIGVPGELLVGNSGLAENYLNLPELTKEKFIESPFLCPAEKRQKKLAGEEIRLYRSGDLARWLEDGSLEYIDRIDCQVKVRGFRIELGEIEAVLNKHPGVEHAVARVVEKDNSRQIVAYYVVNKNSINPLKTPKLHQLKHYLKNSLPDYMLPHALIEVESIPLTANMKIDFKALTELSSQNISHNHTYEPKSEVEKLLTAIWEKTLNIPFVNITDNFFSVGGDSMSSIRVVYAAREKNLNFNVSDIFKYQTIKELAKKCGSSNSLKPAIQSITPFSLISLKDKQKLHDRIEDAYPQALLQTGMLYHSINTPGAGIYIDVLCYYVFTEFNDVYFRDVVKIMIRENPVLRTSFNLTDYSEPLQLVHADVEPKIVVFDLSYLPDFQQEQNLESWIEQEKTTLINYEKPPLFWFTIHKLSKYKFVLSLTTHHAILDGWSIATLLTKLFKKYELYLNHKNQNMENLIDFNYKFFIAQEKEASVSNHHSHFWKNELVDYQFTRINSWPSECQRDLVKEFEILIDQELSNKLQELVQKINAPLDTILLSVHLKLLSVLTGNDDIITGVVFNGRPELKNIEQTLGLFLNSLPFRQCITDGSWKDLILQTFAKKTTIYSYRLYPLAKIYEDVGTNELFDILFYFVNFHVYKELTTENIGILMKTRKSVERTNFSLVFIASIDPTSNKLSCVLQYHTKVFGRAQIAVIAQYYKKILETMANNYNSSHNNIDLLTSDRADRIFHEFNNTKYNFEYNKAISTLFEVQVKKFPNKNAVIFDNFTLTYKQLNQKANQLAGYLHNLGVGKSSCVIVYMERSLEIVIAILAIFKAGGIYVPLDLNFPVNRVEDILNDTSSRIILTKTTAMKSKHFTPNLRKYSINLDSICGTLKDMPAEDLHIETKPVDLAYIIYTSGSTGKPKGVMIEHYSLINLLFALREKIAIKQHDVFLALTSISFDISLVEFFLPLLSGASCVISDQNMGMFPSKIIDVIEKNHVTVVQATPTTWRILFDNGWENQHDIKILCGGEALAQDLAKKIIKYRKTQPAWNLYGPTETTIWSTICPIDSPCDQFDYYPIGKPLINTKVFILNRNFQLNPVGVTGELYIGGKGLARGYLNNSKLNTEKFLKPFLLNSSAIVLKEPNLKNIRLYRTGDLAELMPDGNIIFRGRVDNQIKIRGYRIEPGEVEFALLQHVKIKQCLVITNTKDESEQLSAYLILHEACSFSDANELREFLRKKLPHYMIPDKFLVVDKFPINISGKIDAKRLRCQKARELSLNHLFLPPSTDEQKELAEVWCTVLNIADASLDDNFFELGGNSLLTLKLINKVKDKFRVTLELIDVIELATLIKISNKISQLRTADKGTTMTKNTFNFTRKIPDPVVTLQDKGQKKPLFFIHPVGGGVFYYLPLAKQLGFDRPIYAIQDPGIETGDLLFHNIPEMAEFYILAIKCYQASGPYFISGSSFGANVALEIARQLVDQGESVAFIGLLDGIARYPAEVTTNRTSFDKILNWQLLYLHNQLPEFDIPKLFLDLHWHRQQMLVQQIIPKLTDLKLTLFKAIDILDVLKSANSDANLWDEYSPKSLKIHSVPGNHFTMHFKPNVNELAKILNACLINAENEHKISTEWTGIDSKL